MPQSNRNIIIIGIAGASGSGKSLLANTIVDELGSDRVVVISEDAYYKDLSDISMEERNKVNFDHPDAFDHKLLVQHLSQLKAGHSINVPIYDYVTHNRTHNTRHISSDNSIVVLEGILLFSEPLLRDLMDIRIFVDTALDTSFIRRLRRDVMERGRNMESVIEQYETTVRPMFVQFIEPSKRHADIIVPHGGKNRIAIEVIQAKMKELLNHHIVK
ncbi:MAG: udk [Gammaproteobacteria bacterium]|jgi:uridine kinase|nr:udk [Gammaproteobacteria bacterium]